MIVSSGRYRSPHALSSQNHKERQRQQQQRQPWLTTPATQRRLTCKTWYMRVQAQVPFLSPIHSSIAHMRGRESERDSVRVCVCANAGGRVGCQGCLHGQGWLNESGTTFRPMRVAEYRTSCLVQPSTTLSGLGHASAVAAVEEEWVPISPWWT